MAVKCLDAAGGSRTGKEQEFLWRREEDSENEDRSGLKRDTLNFQPSYQGLLGMERVLWRKGRI